MEALAHRKRDVDLVGVQRDAARDQRDLVESVGTPGAAPDTDLEFPRLAVLIPGDVLAGFQSGLLQGVLTPMNGGGSANYTRALSFNRMYRTLEYLVGVSDDDVHRLRSVGIRHTNQLLHRASLDIDRQRLSKKTGITSNRLLEFVNQCTLLEVSGMDRWLPLVRRLGITSMPDLRAQDARALHARLLEAIGLAGAPTLYDVQYWISQATALDIVESPEAEKAVPVID